VYPCQFYPQGIALDFASPIADAALSGPTSGLSGITVNFFSTGSTDPDGTIASYNWDFGDGSTSTDENPSHPYTQVGDYTATLTVTDNSGLSSAPATVTITVLGADMIVSAI